jgi:hypothetical protein
MSWILFILGILTTGLAVREWHGGNGSRGIILTLCILTTLAWIPAIAGGNSTTEWFLGVPAALFWGFVVVRAYRR